jgi:hypothetical protein
MGHKVEAGPKRFRHHIPRPYPNNMITRPDQIHRLPDRPPSAGSFVLVAPIGAWNLKRIVDLVVGCSSGLDGVPVLAAVKFG